MNDKIQPTHLARTAAVYIRQSTLRQVRENVESSARQYALKERALELGFQTAIVIDEDLGKSGTGTVERPGFARLVTEVCAGHVGAVFALEASRLARNSRDWHHLIDLCMLTETLVVDHDGVYDPRLLNDRLLLGLKGTMSEFEVSLLRQRASEAKRLMRARGEILHEVPVGYVRADGRRCEMVADRQVRQAVSGVFTKFRELGSARQVYLWYHQEVVKLPQRRRDAEREEYAWELPVYGRILAMIKHPIYAGAYGAGLRRKQTVLVDGRPRRISQRIQSPDEWEVLIQDHHQGYIDWDEYQRNQRALAVNSAVQGMMGGGAAKEGPALLGGLLRCQRCGHKLHVVYSGLGGRVPRYQCQQGRDIGGLKACLAFGGARIEQAVVAQVLSALRPVAVDASIEASAEISTRESEKRRALNLAVEKAGYEAERLRRQYDSAEPENRLVAGELEKRWNDALTALHELEARLAATVDGEIRLGEKERARLLELGQDVEGLWYHPDASAALRKRILRTVLVEIAVDINADPSEVALRLHWAGGVHTTLRVRRARVGESRQSTPPEVVEIVSELAKVCEDSTIAATLNRLGLETGKGNRWNKSLVRSLRSYREIPVFRRDAERPWITMTEAAQELGISLKWAHKLLKRKVLPGKQPAFRAPWVIARADLSLPQVRVAAEAIRQGERPLTASAQTRFPFPEGR